MEEKTKYKYPELEDFHYPKNKNSGSRWPGVMLVRIIILLIRGKIWVERKLQSCPQTPHTPQTNSSWNVKPASRQGGDKWSKTQNKVPWTRSFPWPHKWEFWVRVKFLSSQFPKLSTSTCYHSFKMLPCFLILQKIDSLIQWRQTKN